MSLPVNRSRPWLLQFCSITYFLAQTKRIKGLARNQWYFYAWNCDLIIMKPYCSSWYYRIMSHYMIANWLVVRRMHNRRWLALPSLSWYPILFLEPVPQPQIISSHQPKVDVAPATHNLTFSSSMSNEDFFKWIGSKGISDKDCNTLSGMYKVPLTTNLNTAIMYV
jgi:hypothetical protein